MSNADRSGRSGLLAVPVTMVVSVVVAVVVAYLLAAALTDALLSIPDVMAPSWLAAGVTFGALRMAGPRYWWPVLAAGWLAALLWSVFGESQAFVAALLQSTLEVIPLCLGAWVARLASRGSQVNAVWQLGWMVAGTALAALVGATLIVEYAYRIGIDGGYGLFWLEWALAYASGILIMAPLIEQLSRFKVRRSGGLTSAQFWAGAAAFGVFLGVSWITFGSNVLPRFGSLASTLAYLPVPFLLLSAWLWGPLGGACAMAAGFVLLIGRTASGAGPFAISDAFHGEAVVEVQIYVLIWALLILLIQALSAARRQSLADTRHFQLRYERTLDAMKVAAVEFDAQTGAANWSPGAAAALGLDVALLRSAEDWLALVDPAERAAVAGQWQALLVGQPGPEIARYGIQQDAAAIRVQVDVAPVLGPTGQVEHLVALIRRVDTEATKAGHAHE